MRQKSISCTVRNCLRQLYRRCSRSSWGRFQSLSRRYHRFSANDGKMFNRIFRRGCRRLRRRDVLILLGGFALLLFMTNDALAAPLIPSVNVDVGSSGKPQDVAVTLQVMALLTILSLAPGILIMTTSFVRIVVVIGFLRNALSTQNVPLFSNDSHFCSANDHPERQILSIALAVRFISYLLPVLHQNPLTKCIDNFMRK